MTQEIDQCDSYSYCRLLSIGVLATSHVASQALVKSAHLQLPSRQRGTRVEKRRGWRVDREGKRKLRRDRRPCPSARFAVRLAPLPALTVRTRAEGAMVFKKPNVSPCRAEQRKLFF